MDAKVQEGQSLISQTEHAAECVQQGLLWFLGNVFNNVKRKDGISHSYLGGTVLEVRPNYYCHLPITKRYGTPLQLL